ncbi:hypothetical protein HPB51_022049 [Rhipicephalus microplus]|uniref:Hexosyltransferase n=1 Tax=Rhipicephalus microplus TaxID=6941 RepID=A0A9J6DX50_RHIMP|nr:hypothetical protein HPB51_022049 [Rhipicephalus microplus]
MARKRLRIGCVDLGCVLCVQCSLFVLLPLLVAIGFAVTLLFAQEAPLVHVTLLDVTEVPTEETLADYPVPDAPSKTTTRPTGNPRAEMVIGCRDCDARWPLGGRLVWRTASGQRSSTGGGNDDSVFWDFPDIAMDLHGTWTLCPKLYVLVPTAPERRAQRNAIRATWGWLDQYPNCTLRVVFFLRLPRGREQIIAIKKEYKAFKDIVAHTDWESGGRPRSSSMAAMIVEWVPMHMHSSQWALRVTDDTHVQVLALLDVLESWPAGPPRVFGRAYAGRDHLEGCAYVAKSEDFLRMQPALADESEDQDEGLLVTGRLARKVGLVATHLEGVGPCGDAEAAAVVKERFSKGNLFSATHLTMRGLSPTQMAALDRGHHRARPDVANNVWSPGVESFLEILFRNRTL